MKLFSLKYILIIPFLIQLIGVVGLIGFLSFKNGEKSINELANNLLLENTSRVEENLKYYTLFPVTINKFNAKAIKTGEIKLENTHNLLNHFANQISTSPPYISAIYWGNNLG